MWTKLTKVIRFVNKIFPFDDTQKGIYEVVCEPVHRRGDKRGKSAIQGVRYQPWWSYHTGINKANNGKRGPLKKLKKLA